MAQANPELRREVDTATGTITTWLAYPDPDNNRKGFNLILYPDLELSYRLTVQAEGDAVRNPGAT